jgi:hypothetical protein
MGEAPGNADAKLVLENELYLLDEILRKLWAAYNEAPAT